MRFSALCSEVCSVRRIASGRQREDANQGALPVKTPPAYRVKSGGSSASRRGGAFSSLTAALPIRYLFRGEKLFMVRVSLLPAADFFIFAPVTISLFVTLLPYRSLLVPSSGRSVAPFRAMPANNPRARE